MPAAAAKQNRTMYDQFVLRLPDGLRDRIAKAADLNNRSMNSEILFLICRSLDEAFKEPKVDSSRIEGFVREEVERQIGALIKRVDALEQVLGDQAGLARD
jgi:hypothetical protein